MGERLLPRNRHSRPISTVIPAQAGIQKCLIGSRLGFDNAVLDSRLRGNDGCGRPPLPRRFL